MNVTLAGEAELRRLVSVDEAGLDPIADGFVRLARGEVTQPPVLRVDVPEANGEVDVKSAYVPGWDAFAVKLSSGFFDNPARGLPSASGMMILIDASTGVPRALLLDGGYLTDVRTALAGGVAARALAPRTVHCAGVLGAGAQARAQLRAASLVRPFRRALVWARRPQAAEEAAAGLTDELGLEVRAAADPETVVRESELVITATPAREPILRADWLHPGLHVTAMGSDAEDKQELEVAVLQAADRVIGDHPPQNARLGELRAAADAGLLGALRPVALGDVLSERAPGRTGEDEITVADLTGTGVQDTVIARLAYQRVREAGAGTAFTG